MLGRKLQQKMPLGNVGLVKRILLKLISVKIGCNVVDWILMAQYKVQ
jgi:hypothetical protein